MGGQAFKLTGHIKSKGPSCNEPRMLHESRVSQAHRWKGLASSLQGHLARIGICSHIILTRGPSHLLHEYYSTAQQPHDMLFLHPADHACPLIVSYLTVALKEQTKSKTVSNIHIYNSICIIHIFCHL